MNTNNVVSLPVAVDLSATTNTNLAVSFTATGVNVAALAADISIGTLLQGNPALNVGTGVVALGQACTVFLHGNVTIRFVVCGSGTAIAVGDQIERSTAGTYIKKSAGTVAGIAIETVPATSTGGAFRALMIGGAV